MKVLYLEDNPDDVELVRMVLAKDGIPVQLHTVDSRSEFIEAIRSERFDVILSDHSLPQFNSVEALRICSLAHLGVPFILVTGAVSEEFAVKCLKQGADDYVLKSNLMRLPAAIGNSIRQRRLATERLSAELTLRNQNEELVKINQELDGIVYSVSHNLRAPLLSVLGLINLIHSEQLLDDPAMTRYLRMMKDSVERLDETLKSILDYSRNSRLEAVFVPVDLRALINCCVENLKFMKGFEELSISIEFTEEEHSFVSDSYRLSMIISNLMSNAIKYRDSQKGGSWLRITTTVTQSKLFIRFEDNGIGIDDSVVGSIFRMFFRGTERSDGAGLGLYIVKETVEKLNGTIELTSKLGEGTAFLIVLPNGNQREAT